VLIDRDSVKSGEAIETCTRRTARPVSAATTLPLTDDVPFWVTTSRGGALAPLETRRLAQ